MLLVITGQKAIDLRNHQKRQKRGSGAVVAESALAGSNDHPFSLDQLEDSEPTPEFAGQVADELSRLLDQLDDPVLRSVAVWKMEGFTNEEIAGKLGCVPRSVERKLRVIRSVWAGEGMLGLGRAFHVAGAHTLVASLWQVDDAAAAVLMEEFYRNFWDNKLPKLDALRQAQLTLRAHPERVDEKRRQLQADLAERGLKLGKPADLPNSLVGWVCHERGCPLNLHGQLAKQVNCVDFDEPSPGLPRRRVGVKSKTGGGCGTRLMEPLQPLRGNFGLIFNPSG